MGAAILVVLVVVGGLVAGYVGMFRSFALGRRVADLENALRILEQRANRQTVPVPEARAESRPMSPAVAAAPAAPREPVAPSPIPAEPAIRPPQPVPTPIPTAVTPRVAPPAVSAPVPAAA